MSNAPENLCIRLADNIRPVIEVTQIDPITNEEIKKYFNYSSGQILTDVEQVSDVVYSPDAFLEECRILSCGIIPARLEGDEYKAFTDHFTICGDMTSDSRRIRARNTITILSYRR